MSLNAFYAGGVLLYCAVCHAIGWFYVNFLVLFVCFFNKKGGHYIYFIVVINTDIFINNNSSYISYSYQIKLKRHKINETKNNILNRLNYKNGRSRHDVVADLEDAPLSDNSLRYLSFCAITWVCIFRIINGSVETRNMRC